MEAVDVLGGIDRLDHLEGGDVLRQRQLNEDAVDRGVGVEALDDREQVMFRGFLGKHMLEGAHAGLDRTLALGLHIDPARRIVADEHDREAGRTLAGVREALHGSGDAGPQGVRKGGSVDDLSHGCLLSFAGRGVLRASCWVMKGWVA